MLTNNVFHSSLSGRFKCSLKVTQQSQELKLKLLPFLSFGILRYRFEADERGDEDAGEEEDHAGRKAGRGDGEHDH